MTEQSKELTQPELDALKEIAAGHWQGLHYPDSQVLGLLRAGYVTEYMRPVLKITEEGKRALAANS